MEQEKMGSKRKYKELWDAMTNYWMATLVLTAIIVTINTIIATVNPIPEGGSAIAYLRVSDSAFIRLLSLISSGLSVYFIYNVYKRNTIDNILPQGMLTFLIVSHGMGFAANVLMLIDHVIDFGLIIFLTNMLWFANMLLAIPAVIVQFKLLSKINKVERLLQDPSIETNDSLRNVTGGIV